MTIIIDNIWNKVLRNKRLSPICGELPQLVYKADMYIILYK